MSAIITADTHWTDRPADEYGSNSCIEWREAVGFPNYLLSTEGGVVRIGYVDELGAYRRPKFIIVSDGSLRKAGLVSLYKGGRQYSRSLANIMLRTFVGPPPPDKPSACHKDDNRLNNKLSNLRWGSQKDNAKDGIQNGIDLGLNTRGLVRITDGSCDRRISTDLRFPKGWWLGRSNSKMKNRFYVTNGVVSRMLPVGSSVPVGWRLGRTL